MDIDQARYDCARKQKKGLHFILASIFIWLAIFVLSLTSLPILTKNLLTFCLTATLMPVAYMISKAIQVDFTNKGNPLTNLGLLFSLNQMLYLLIAMWVYPTVPEKMVMVIAMLIIGNALPAYFVAGSMVLVEIVFSPLLFNEVKHLSAE